MKDIIYSKDSRILYIADQGEYHGVKYFIVAGGIHPCAYVMCDEKYIQDHYDGWGGLEGIRVHGGVTWTDPVEKLKKHPDGFSGSCFGWDYGHASDWAGYISDEDNIRVGSKKWTTEEILDECHLAIDQYLGLKTII